MFFRQKKRFKGLLKGDMRVTFWDQYQLLYVRVPKSGNSSIRRSIEHGEKRRMSKVQIMAAQKGWTTFSFVRNPWARVLSAFRHKASNDTNSPRMVDGVYQGFLDHGIAVRADMGFDEFCELICAIPDDKTDKHLRSQSAFLIHEDEPIVPFIGKIENMEDDWGRLMQQLDADIPIKHINRTQESHQHYSDFYSNPALINLVGDRYAEDVRRFSYDFERR
jgi:hypothetical protein